MEADEKLYIVSRRHADSNEVIFDRPVTVCTTCGVVYVAIEGVYGRPEWSCPLGHRQ